MVGTIPVILSLISGGIELLRSERQRALQSGELTSEQDAQLDDKLEKMFAGQQWKTDDELAKEKEDG